MVANFSSHVFTYIYIRDVGDSLLIKTLIKFMAVKHNPSLISCNKVLWLRIIPHSNVSNENLYQIPLSTPEVNVRQASIKSIYFRGDILVA